MKIIFFCIIYFFCYCSPVFSTNLANNASANKGISTELLSVQPRSRVSSFILSPQSLQEILNKGEDLVLVDVRSSDKFQKFRIPGSMNIPLYTLKTKGFLKSKSLILINEGYGYRGLEQECEKLKNLGFQSVRILYGGLNYWRDTNGQLEGDFFDIDAIGEISPAKYFVDRDYDDWVVIDVSQPGDKTGRELIPGMTNIPCSGNGEKFLLKFEQVIHNQDTPLLTYVLIVNGAGQNYGKIKQVIKTGKNIFNIFYLKGGLAAYRKYLKNQQSLWRPHKKTIKKCVSCP